MSGRGAAPAFFVWGDRSDPARFRRQCLCRAPKMGLGESTRGRKPHLSKQQQEAIGSQGHSALQHATPYLYAEIRRSSTGGGPSGEFGTRNSPRAGPNHSRGVWTKYNRRLARRRPPGGAPDRARAGGVVRGLGYRSAGSYIPAAQYHGPAVFWAIARDFRPQAPPMPAAALVL
jgi:hypothetical protein